MVLCEHAFNLRTLRAAIYRFAAGESKNEFQNHAADLRVGVADALRRFELQYFTGGQSRRLSRQMAARANRLHDVHGRIFGVGVPEKIPEPSTVSATRPARARSDGRRARTRRIAGHAAG